MSDYYDATNERDYYRALQRRINDGSIWHFEGSAGRAAMQAIEDGYCCLGRQGHCDYWSNYVPSRRQVKRGTKGSLTYVRAQMGDAWARSIGRI